MGTKHFSLQCFDEIRLARSLEPLPKNTVIYSVLEQVVRQAGLNLCYIMDTKHCILQCFGTSGLERTLEPSLQNMVIYSVLGQVV